MTTENLDKTLRRISKLLSLSTSANVHEASAAASEAQRLMTENRISEAMLDVENGTEDETVSEIEILADTGTKTPRTWLVQLAHGIAMANGCRVLVCKASHNGRPGRIDMYGRKADLDGARYLFMTMKNEIDRLALAWKDDTEGLYGRSGVFSFKLGAAVEIVARMRTAKTDYENALKASINDNNKGTALAVSRW